MMKNFKPIILTSLGLVLASIGSILSVKQDGYSGLLLSMFGVIMVMVSLVLLLRKRGDRKKSRWTNGS